MDKNKMTLLQFQNLTSKQLQDYTLSLPIGTKDHKNMFSYCKEEDNTWGWIKYDEKDRMIEYTNDKGHWSKWTYTIHGKYTKIIHTSNNWNWEIILKDDTGNIVAKGGSGWGYWVYRLPVKKKTFEEFMEDTYEMKV